LRRSVPHTLIACLLFLGTSLYLGTGWSLVLFSVPIAPLLTVDTDNPEAVELHAGYHDFAWVRKPITFSALANRLDELFTRRPPPRYTSPMSPPARTWRRSGQFQD
jgi:hypothetical protein